MNEPEPLPEWEDTEDPGVREVFEVLYELDDRADPADLVAHLLAKTVTESEALRVMAAFLLRFRQTNRSRFTTEKAVEDLPEWETRRCPTCGTVCDECLANAETELREALEMGD